MAISRNLRLSPRYENNRTYWEISAKLQDGWVLYARLRRAPDDKWSFIVAQENGEQFILVTEEEYASMREEAEDHLDSEELAQYLQHLETEYVTRENFTMVVENLDDLIEEIKVRWSAVNYILRCANTL